jgi:predicted glycoside hydrolase/deacetylase ChbG (UPF0249 family)
MNERHIIICADDYGISPAVNAAIRDLIVRQRINATSVIVAAPSFSRAEAQALLVAAGSRAAIGLHVTLTAPFRPLSHNFAPLRNGAFLPLPATLGRAFVAGFKIEQLVQEISSQFAAFSAAFGRVPDFVDGHQHAHLFPQIRDAFLRATKKNAPNAWVRQCGRAGRARTVSDPKALLLNGLSRSFRRFAADHGLRTNPGFAGTYVFRPGADYAAQFPGFLDRLPNGGVIMCHPGLVDAELKRIDPVTDLRAREYAFFGGDAFVRLLAEQGITL